MRSAWFTFAAIAVFAFPLFAQDEEDETGGKVEIDWVVEPAVRSVEVDGNEDTYRSQLNEEDGLFLSEILFRVRNENGVFEEFRLEANGFGAEPSEQFRASLSKSDLYRFDLLHFRSDNVSVPADEFGRHGYSNERRSTQGTLTLFPSRPLELRLGYGRQRSKGLFGTTYHNPWTEVPVGNDRRWTADDLGGELRYREGNLSLALEHRYRDYSSTEVRDLAADADRARVSSYHGVINQSAPRRDSKATLFWKGKHLDLQARYVRRGEDSDLGDTNRRVVETTPAGGERETESRWTGNGSRRLSGGELVGSWHVSEPVTVVLRFEDSRETLDASTEETRDMISFGIPTTLVVPARRRTEVDLSRVSVGAQLQSLGPWSFSAGGGTGKREVRIDWWGDVAEQDRTVAQAGKFFYADGRFQKRDWTVSASRGFRTLDAPYTTASALDEKETLFRVKKRLPKGWAVHARASQRDRTNTSTQYGVSPVYDTRTRSVSFGADHVSDRLSLSAGVAYLDTETETIVLEEASPEISTWLFEEFSDATSHFDASWQVKPGLRAELHAYRLKANGAADFEVSHVEPQLRVGLGKKKSLLLGAFHHEWNGDGAFKARGVTVGVRIGNQDE